MFSQITRGLRRKPARGAYGGLAPPVIVPAVRVGLPNEAFTPTQPRTTRTMFIGRQWEIETIMQGLLEDRAHVVLYSDRGRGKTSLSNIIVEAMRRSGTAVTRYQCEAGSTFDTFIRGLARNLPSSLLTGPMQAEQMEGCEAALPSTPVRPKDVVALLTRLRLRSLVCVIDEFDRVTDPATRTTLADTIKQLSDRRVALLFMIIGVSDSLEQLIGQHPSIQRNLIAIPLPLLSDDEIAGIVERGAAQAGLNFPPDLVAKLTAVSRGMPYIVHLLGLRTAQFAARRGSHLIEHEDFTAAVNRLIQETPPRVTWRLDELTANGQDEAMLQALTEVATCYQDRWGHMPVVEKPGESALIGGRSIPWNCWLNLFQTGVIRWCSGNVGHVTLAERELFQYIFLGVAAEQYGRDQPSDDRYPDDRSGNGRQSAAAHGNHPQGATPQLVYAAPSHDPLGWPDTPKRT